MQASTVVAFPSYFTDPYAYPLLPLGDSAYYAAGGGGLAYVPLNGRPASIMPAGPRRNMLSSSLLTLAMPDRSGNLWLGTEGGGLNMLDTRGFRFEGYTPSREQEEAPDLMVKSLCDVDGRLWIGTFNQGLYVLGQDRQLAKHIAPSVSGNERISVLQHDSKGRLWMNREAQIGYVDKGSAQFIRSTLIPDGHAVNVAAMSLYELGPDRFLLGSIDHLHYMTLGADGNITIRPIAQRSAVTTGQIAALERGPDGSIFMGKVRDGFYHLRIFPEQDSVAILDHGFHQTGIRDFQTVGGGKYLWMATENGLLFYNTATRRYRMIDEADGLSNSHIYGILPQDDSAVWVSTNRGLNQVHYRLTGGSLQLRCVHAFTAADGLQSNEFNTGAFCKLNDGSFAFGGVVGVNWFNPVKQPSNPHLPQVAITGIRVLSHPLQSDTDAAFLHSLTLPYDSNTVAFSFAALEFTAPAGNRCQYRLQGFDNDWVDGGEDREARYANLPPGHYRFLVRAANADGVWNPAPAKLSLVIVPPWWRTPLAYFIFALLVSATLTLVIRTIIRQRVRRRLRILEREQAVNEERLRISRDMHDELGTGLTKIALLSEVAQRKAVASAQLQPLSEIARTSRQLTEKIGEIVWTLNPQNDTLDTLAAYIREWVQEQYDALGDVHVRTDIPEDLPPLSLGHRTRQALLLVTKEAVNNAVKHSLAAQITVRIRLSASTISFTVSDNGIGFRPGGSSGAGRGNGLGNMAARMQGAGGRFSIGSTPGSGTTIEFSVPRPTE
jgi:signal transduction histidine kinase